VFAATAIARDMLFLVGKLASCPIFDFCWGAKYDVSEDQLECVSGLITKNFRMAVHYCQCSSKW